MSNRNITDCSSGSGWTHRATGRFVAFAFISNIFVYDLGGGEMIDRAKHFLPPEAGPLVQHDRQPPGGITTASSAQIAILEKIAKG